MAISDKDRKELDIFEWPHLNIRHLNDQDYERIHQIFARMKSNGSESTVDELVDYITTRHGAAQFPPWTLENIVKIARTYFPISEAS